MTDCLKPVVNSEISPQCQFFVLRKKRLCRMTVKPGRQYCGEHEPQPKTEDGQSDTRIPCPNDPKHTCYISKLAKHLAICNAREGELPPYIQHNINAPPDTEEHPRIPLSKIPREALMQLIDKVNNLYDKHVKGKISTLPEQEIHSTVLEDFSEPDRTESSRRHLRQTSRLLQVIEEEGLVRDNTCYVELGAGKGQLSYYAWHAWCSRSQGSSVLLVDRASLRHKRDNKLRDLLTNSDVTDQGTDDVTAEQEGDDVTQSRVKAEVDSVRRLRADLAHLALHQVPDVERATHLVGFAKHLCGVATDFALRCLCGPSSLAQSGGAAVATCCHHRCERGPYVGTKYLQDLGISGEEFTILVGIVSWATCGDGRNRQWRAQINANKLNAGNQGTDSADNRGTDSTASQGTDKDAGNQGTDNFEVPGSKDQRINLPQEYREEVGRRAKALLDWGRVLYLRDKGFDARLCYYVPSSVSLENVCIVAKKVS